MRNASERKDIRRAEKFAAEAERAQIEFIVAAMGTKQGRAWFHNLLSRCHIFADPFTNEALLEAYSKGERNIGLMIYNDIVSNCPDYFVTMMKEATIQEQLNVRRASDDTADDEYSGGPESDGGNY